MKRAFLKSVIVLTLGAGIAVSMTAGCSGGAEVSKAEANKPAPPPSEKTIPGEPESTPAAKR